MKTLKNQLIICFTSIILIGCASLYDPVTHAKTIQTKTQALSLVDKGTEAFSSHTSEVNQLKGKLAERLAYEKAKKKNEITTQMWEILNNDNKLIKSYLKLWEQKGTLNSAFVDEAKPQIEKAFDLLIDYEEKKDKSGSQPLVDFINNL